MDVEWGICMNSPAIQREQGWGRPHCKFQTDQIKSVPTALIVRKRRVFWPKYRFRTLHFKLTRCNCHMQQMPGAANRHRVEAGLRWVLERWWFSPYTVQDNVRKLLVSDNYYIAYSICHHEKKTLGACFERKIFSRMVKIHIPNIALPYFGSCLRISWMLGILIVSE